MRIIYQPFKKVGVCMSKFREFIEAYWQITVGITVILLAGVFLIFQRTSEANEDSLETIIEEIEPNQEIENTQEVITEKETMWVMVDIKGFVNHPGVYEVLSESRVKDVVELAGGFNQEANTLTVNLAEKVRDQMVIYVGGQDDAVVIGNEPSLDDNSSQVVNINLASKEELMQLNSIGEVKAESIIKYREENGGFNTIEDLMNVSGIGQKTFEILKENLAV